MSEHHLLQTPGGTLTQVLLRRLKSKTKESSNVPGEHPNRVGNLNGKWSILLRLMLILWPVITVIVIPWGVWVTSEIFAAKAFRESGERFTKADGMSLRADVEAKSNERMAEQTKLLAAISERLARIETKLDNHNK